MCPWNYSVKGYTFYGNNTNALAASSGATGVFNGLYKFKRNKFACEDLLQLTPANLLDESTMVDYLNIGHDVVANLVMLMNLASLVQYNQAFGDMASVFTKVISRAIRLYRRAQNITLPVFVLEEAIRDGMIVHHPPAYAPHVRVWSFADRVAYGTSGTVTGDYTISFPTAHTTLGTDAGINDLLNDIEKGILALETLITYSANVAADFLAIKSLFDFCLGKGDAAMGRVSKSESSYPGLFDDLDILSDWYCSALTFTDTKGVGSDVLVGFPVQGMTQYASRIPISGLAAFDSVRHTSALGAVKFYLLDNTVDNYGSGGATILWVAYGCSRPMPAGLQYSEYPAVDMYTREDGWIALLSNNVDFGDGASIRTFQNLGHPASRNIYNPILFYAQLTSAMEFRWIDWVPGFQVWVNEADVLENYCMYAAGRLGIPWN
jgi:hypothetical protein